LQVDVLVRATLVVVEALSEFLKRQALSFNLDFLEDSY
jgi:hypothetical protein